jgi:hypothetical protein
MAKIWRPGASDLICICFMQIMRPRCVDVRVGGGVIGKIDRVDLTHVAMTRLESGDTLSARIKTYVQIQKLPKGKET